MLSQKDLDEINGRPFFRDLIMEQTFDLVTWFYPDQLLTLTVGEQDVINITGYDYSRASGLLDKIRKKLRKGSTHSVRVSDFCDYMHIDDMLVHVFLASLKRENPPPTLQVIASDCTDKPLRKRYEARKDLQQGIIIHMPISLYDELNPLGERMFKRKGFYRCIVRPYEVAQIYEIHINTAREMLRTVRTKEGLPARAYVSIEKFCKVHYVDEDDFRHSLASIHEDDKNIDDDDD